MLPGWPKIAEAEGLALMDWLVLAAELTCLISQNILNLSQLLIQSGRARHAW